MKEVLAGILRHVLTAAGGAGMVVADDEIQMVAAGLITLGGLVWSVIQKRRGK